MRRRETIPLGRLITGLLLVTALLWLTVSTPFVYAADQQYKKELQKKAATASDDNPFSNTTEEKNESSTNLLSEYLHDLPVMEHHFTLITRFYKCHPSDLYFAYHPELISPPPEA